MKVVTSHTIREIDQRAISDFGFSGLQLMENAGTACTDVIIGMFGKEDYRRVSIVAGKGNNGGDGFVIARQLNELGWDVSVFILNERDSISGEAASNLDRLPPGIVFYCPQPALLTEDHRKKINDSDVVIDAILGTGLSNDISGVYLAAIDLINQSGRTVISLDIPSGVHGTTGRILGAAVRADVTITFTSAKLGQILYPGAEYTGKLIIREIGIPAEILQNSPGYDFLNQESMGRLLRRRDRQSHKGNFGHCLVIAGSTGKTGAAALAANSAVRAGSGLVTLAVPESLHHILEVKTTEAMTTPLPDSVSGHLANSAFPAIQKLLANKSVVALGPGIGLRPGTIALVHTLIESIEQPMVIDADGLNALAEDVNLLKRKKTSTMVLTPHPAEMARLLGTSIPDVDAIRISVAQEFATNYGVYLVLKGARTIIASPDGPAAINGSGNPGLASGGTGDVLAGIITSLVGQGYQPWNACCLGVFLHGTAADLVAEKKGEIGITASDIIEALPYAYKRLTHTDTP